MSQAQDLISWLEEEFVNRHNADVPPPLDPTIKVFTDFCRQKLTTIPVVGLSAAAVGMALQMADGNILLLAPGARVDDSMMDNQGSYSVIGGMPERFARPERPTDRSILGR
jgi:hypothetical protein